MTELECVRNGSHLVNLYDVFSINIYHRVNSKLCYATCDRAQTLFDYKNAKVMCAVFVYNINIISSIRTSLCVEGEKSP